MSYGILAFFLLIIILVFTNATFLTLQPGERGVLFQRFSGGLDTENIYQPGFHIIAPWNEMYRYEVREQAVEEAMKVLSSNGLDISVDVTVRYNPEYDKIGELHQEFGINYENSLVRPEIRSSVRKIIGRFTPEELYASKRDEVQILIEEDLSDVLENNYIDLQAILIRDIELPERVKNAIEKKLQAEQTALEYQYILEQERQEAERRIIEANAKAESNRILNASLSDKILTDKGIEATLELAKSPNSKVVVVGGGEGGSLPLILGNQ